MLQLGMGNYLVSSNNRSNCFIFVIRFDPNAGFTWGSKTGSQKPSFFCQVPRDAIPGLSQDPNNGGISISVKLLPCLGVRRALGHHHTFRSKAVPKRHCCRQSGTEPAHLYCRFDAELSEHCSKRRPVTCALVGYGHGY